ncbi:MAG: Gfo/Idh/MocA family oxidoreductase [Planctomycetes bacterium]|nr:Gfo/Idh/MocA family oxidoreductase [Planctomycetota bacterium]
MTRRGFLKRTAAGGMAGLAAPLFVPAPALGANGKPGANECIQIGLIGAGGMGQANLDNCAGQGDVAVTGVCDVWKERRDAVAAKHKDSARTYHDYRELLQRKDIDAVIIATPPHWHALQAIEACEAGKDVYLQKPMTLYLDEALAVRNAARRHGRIFQIGTQIHAEENYRRVVEYVRSGKLGKLGTVRTFNVMNQGPDGLGRPADSSPPADLDWDFWVGPAPLRPFNQLIVKEAYTNCSFMDYSGGWTPGMAPHIIDLPYWALELDFPLVTSCSGGRYVIDDLGDAPDVQEAVWQFPKLLMTWSMSMVNSFGFDFGRGSLTRRLGIYFHGVDATLFADYEKREVIPEGDRLKDPAPPEKSIPASPGHEREWLDAVKSRKQPSCNADYHSKISAAISLANLACRLGRSIRFDPTSEKIVGDPEAAKLARPSYRDPWRFPEKYLDKDAAARG